MARSPFLIGETTINWSEKIGRQKSVTEIGRMRGPWSCPWTRLNTRNLREVIWFKPKWWNNAVRFVNENKTLFEKQKLQQNRGLFQSNITTLILVNAKGLAQRNPCINSEEEEIETESELESG